MFKHTLCTLALTSAIVAPAALAAENWSTDLPASLQQAAKENKLVMVDFNGSDWCGPCIMLKEKVLSTPEFAAYAKDKFILVDIDNPRGDIISAEQKATNRALSTKYEISGFPTILVITPDNIVTGGFVGGRGELGQVEAPLNAAIEVAAKIAPMLKAAEGLQGSAKAKALNEVLQVLPADMRAHNAALTAQIMELDSEDSLGLRAAEAKKKAADELQQEISKKMRECGNDVKALLTYADEVLTRDLPDESRFTVLNIKGNCQIMLSETEADLGLAEATLTGALKYAPEDIKERAKKGLSVIFGDKAKLLENVKDRRAKMQGK